MKRLLGLFILLNRVLMVCGQTFTAPGGIVNDNAGNVCFPVPVAGLDSIADGGFGLIAVCLDITHPNDNDLIISLRSPDGTTTMLSNRNGGSASDYRNTCFSNASNQHIALGAAPFAGSYLPEQSLNLHNNGQDPNGLWFICVQDVDSFGMGKLNGFTLQFAPQPPKDPQGSSLPCGVDNPLKCQCPDPMQSECDLLPDLTGSAFVMQTQHTEYPGLLRISYAYANLGWGPAEVRGQDSCYCDSSLVPCTTASCPGGVSVYKKIRQRIYRKSGNAITHYERDAGFTYYHPQHHHVHVDNWLELSLRQDDGHPDPLQWPIMGKASKVSFCLVNMTDCTNSNGFCQDSSGNTLTMSDLPNAPFGVVSGCGNDQGIYVGKIDIYDQSLPGNEIDIQGVCNGNYHVVAVADAGNHILESNERNNVTTVPVTLTGQTPMASFIQTVAGMDVNFMAQKFQGASYAWDFGDGTASYGQIVQHTYNAAGTYLVKLTAFNGCGNTIAMDTVRILPLRLSNQLSFMQSLKAVPNPSDDKAVLEFELLASSEVAYEISDMTGRITGNGRSAIFPAGKSKWVLPSELQPGFYLIRISFLDSSQMLKFVKR
jgi:hypothetical protein